MIDRREDQMADRTDDAEAAMFIGKHALVGLTFVNADGTLRKQVQVHGRITAVDESVITMRLHGSDEEFTLPPDLESFEPAEPGEYRLRTTGEVVVNPDLLASWTITAPAEDADEQA
jgi:hypothetical protein